MMATKKKVKPIKKTVKPIKKAVKSVKVIKRPRRPVAVCILTGQVFKVSTATLERQAKKYKFPSVQDYLQYYVCKDAIKSLKNGYTEMEIRNKHNCKDKTDLPMKFLRGYAPKIKDRARAKKREQRKALNEFINDPTPGKYILPPKGEPKFLDMKNPDDVRSLTHFACARPHIYLNNGRNCNGCNIYELCCCPIRRRK
jgi:hypothetical protein